MSYDGFLGRPPLRPLARAAAAFAAEVTLPAFALAHDGQRSGVPQRGHLGARGILVAEPLARRGQRRVDSIGARRAVAVRGADAEAAVGGEALHGGGHAAVVLVQEGDQGGEGRRVRHGHMSNRARWVWQVVSADTVEDAQ